MLVEFKRLNIVNEGYKRVISFDKVYLNPTHIISVRDYLPAKDFLLQEGAVNHADKSFSLVKINNANKVEEVIVLGSSKEVYENIKPKSRKGILNG